MNNGDFNVDIKAGVVVFAQRAHGKMHISVSRVKPGEQFNIGVGQLIAMKRNEIEIRQADIKTLTTLRTSMLSMNEIERANKNNLLAARMYANFAGILSEKINASRNHVVELRRDLKRLYQGTYDLPEEIKTQKSIYAVVNGSVAIVKNPFIMQDQDDVA